MLERRLKPAGRLVLREGRGCPTPQDEVIMPDKVIKEQGGAGPSSHSPSRIAINLDPPSGCFATGKLSFGLN
jgi:hypothetical protein